MQKNGQCHKNFLVFVVWCCEGSVVAQCSRCLRMAFCPLATACLVLARRPKTAVEQRSSNAIVSLCLTKWTNITMQSFKPTQLDQRTKYARTANSTYHTAISITHKFYLPSKTYWIMTLSLCSSALPIWVSLFVDLQIVGSKGDCHNPIRLEDQRFEIHMTMVFRTLWSNFRPYDYQIQRFEDPKIRRSYCM